MISTGFALTLPDADKQLCTSSTDQLSVQSWKAVRWSYIVMPVSPFNLGKTFQ